MTTKYRESEEDKKLRKWFTNDLSRALLRGIELRNGHLRGLTPFKISIDYPISVIAGRNGAGKSTILAMASCAYHNNKNGFKLKKRRNTYYTFSDFFVQHTEEVPPQGIEIYYLIAHDNWKKNDRFPEGKGLGLQNRVKRKGGKWNDYDRRVVSNVVFLGIDRIVPHSERSQSKSYSKAFTETAPKGWETDIAQAVGYILGKKYTKLRYLEHSKYSLPIVECGGVKYSGLNMGAGENALFEIFRVIHSCAEGALLVIDEIELGLHIDAQRKFIKKLKQVCLERKIQVICTTHSKDIFDSVPPDARKFVENVGGVTMISEGISPDFAMSKMGANELKELTVLLEDGIATEILAFALPTNLRQRICCVPVGSALALSRQLAAAYARKEIKPIIAVFDGDQRNLFKDNLEHARKMAELTDSSFEKWFTDRITYLPGDTWPEAWLLQSNQEFVESLAISLATDKNLLAEYLEYGLQAGKHNEFRKLALQLGLEKHQCVQALMMNLRNNNSEVFSEILRSVECKLE
jgi:predicted ATPase